MSDMSDLSDWDGDMLTECDQAMESGYEELGNVKICFVPEEEILGMVVKNVEDIILKPKPKKKMTKKKSQKTNKTPQGVQPSLPEPQDDRPSLPTLKLNISLEELCPVVVLTNAIDMLLKDQIYLIGKFAETRQIQLLSLKCLIKEECVENYVRLFGNF